jgi:hypothetical protein
MTELAPEAVSHLYPVLIILGAVVTVIGGVVLALFQGWKAIIGEIKTMLGEHTESEERWQRDISKRLTRLERNVGAIRDHLIAADIIEITGSHQLNEDDTQP